MQKVQTLMLEQVFSVYGVVCMMVNQIKKNLMKLIESILEMEPDVLSLADSSGMAEPEKISSHLNKLLKKKPNLKN